MESLGDLRNRSLVFASFLKILRRFGAFCVVLVSHLRRYQFRAIFAALQSRQSNLNSKLNFGHLLFPNFPSMNYIYIYFIDGMFRNNDGDLAEIQF